MLSNRASEDGSFMAGDVPARGEVTIRGGKDELNIPSNHASFGTEERRLCGNNSIFMRSCHTN